MPVLALPSAEIVKSLLHYDPETGVFTWRCDGVRTKSGRVAGTVRKGAPKCYVSIGIDYKVYLAHRLAWLYVTGRDPGATTIDHIDGNGLNNTFANLRLADMRQQNWNLACRWGDLPTGVRFHATCRSRPWQARLKQRSLGYFATAEEAAQAYKAAYAEAAKEFSHTAR